ncbi:hypothetical protein BD410DRAFT_732882, partial [Rickenella mellea]
KKVITVVADNATNNDTLMESLEERCESRGIPFSAVEARMRCMPHTVRLAALKAIGAVPKNRNSAAQSQNYQEIVTAPVGKDADDNDLVNQADEPEPVDPASLRKVVRAVRASPQCRRAWLSEVKFSIQKTDEALEDIAKMLILDVLTRWSSTHQMMCELWLSVKVNFHMTFPGRALLYRSEIDSFVAKNRELRKFELSSADRDAIKMVFGWFQCFRDATTQMSATKHSTLSSVRCPQRFARSSPQTLRDLPSTAPLELKDGLLQAQRKLPDYFSTFDASPYYTWSSRA